MKLSQTIFAAFTAFTLLWIFLPHAVAGETFQVDRFDDANGPCDPGDCSLREALLAAEATPETDTVLVPPGVHTLSIPEVTSGTLDQGDLEVLHFDVEIVAPEGATIDAQGLNGVFRFLNSTSRMENLTITGGSNFGTPEGFGGFGGGIFCESSDLELSRVWIKGNEAFRGGGLAIQLGTVILEDSTVSENRSETSAGGIYVFGISATRPGRVELLNTTVSGNESPQSGSAVHASAAGQLYLEYATVVENTRPGQAGIFPDLFPQFSLSDVRYSLVEGTCEAGPDAACIYLASEFEEVPVTDLGLESLALNGGRTPTHALSLTSPAVDVVPLDAECRATDQRGVARPVDGDLDDSARCDAGAFELTTAEILPVPSLGELGWWLFGLLLATTALLVLRR